MRKLTYEYVKEKFETNGYILFELKCGLKLKERAKWEWDGHYMDMRLWTIHIG